MNKITVAIIFGGISEEHDISVKSAVEIAKNIDTKIYQPIYIGISRNGTWLRCKTPCAGWQATDCTKAFISPSRETHGLIDEHGQTQHIDVVFPVLHGKFGEDGSIQGLLELSAIPYVGCGVWASAVCFDKALTYVVAKNAGIDVPQCKVINGNTAVDAGSLPYPVFVKPARSGSSFGVTKVSCAQQLQNAIQLAAQFDSKVLIEEAIIGREIGCAVMGNASHLSVGEVDEITLTHGFFKIHQEQNPEQGSENSNVTVPANVPENTRARMQQTAKQIYSALGCTGLARVDMFLEDSGRIVLNEVNTLPGFTSYSRYPRMMNAAGITIADTIDRLIKLASENR